MLKSLTIFMAINLFIISSIQAAPAPISVKKTGGDYATIQAAIDAATSGTVITIGDSQTYDETITINKTVVLVAASGQTPTIRAATGQTYAVKFITGGEGSQLGDVDGGKITVNANGVGGISFTELGVAAVLVENVDLTNTGAVGIEFGSFPPGPDAGASVTFRRVNANVSVNDIVKMTMANEDALSTAVRTVNFERCKLQTSGTRVLWMNAGNPTVNFDFCELRSTQVDTGGRIVHNNNNTTPYKLNFYYCLLSGREGVWAASMNDGATVSFDHTVVVSNANTFVSAATLEAANGIFTADHSDFISPATGTSWTFNVAAASRTFTMTNCNVINTANGFALRLTAPTGGADVYHHNNVLSATGTAYGAGAAAQAGDQSVDPAYVSIATGNATYTNVDLFQAGVSGTYIGSYADLTDAVNATETAGPEIPAAARNNWTIYRD